jgi:TolB protein
MTLLAALALMPTRASATFPGANGIITMVGVEIDTQDEQGDPLCERRYPTDIYRMQPDGSEIEVLHDGEGWARSPRWSPDGARVAFSDTVGDSPSDDSHLYTMAADGSDRQLVTGLEGSEVGPSWSPGGDRIAYQYAEPGRFTDIYSINVDGSDRQQLTSNENPDGNPSWSPTGRRIAFVSSRRGSQDIYTMNAQGTDTRRVTKDVTALRFPSGAYEFGQITTLTWSPNGRWILFDANRGSLDERGKPPFVYKVRPDGSHKTRLHKGWFASWSPDGTKILFLGDRPPEDRCAPELYEMSPNGKNVRRLDTRNDVEFIDMDWQPA